VSAASYAANFDIKFRLLNNLNFPSLGLKRLYDSLGTCWYTVQVPGVQSIKGLTESGELVIVTAGTPGTTLTVINYIIIIIM
jgi:hypothetical protein